jgi:hypothetical protein
VQLVAEAIADPKLATAAEQRVASALCDNITFNMLL